MTTNEHSTELVASTNALLVREADGTCRPATAEEVLGAARSVISVSMKCGTALDAPGRVKDFLRIRLHGLEHETFGAIFVDAQHRVIEYRELFRGTLTQTSVYPREVVKEALSLNAAALLLAHNHPSGHPEPSRADEHLTQVLKAALHLVDVRVLDHFVVGGSEVVSFAERGLL